MKDYILLITIILVFISACSKSEKFSSDLPGCIDEITQDTIKNSTLKSVELMYVNGKHHYWLKTDHLMFDGPEFIVNSQCDTICFLCAECSMPPCATEYKNRNWETIWEQ